MSKRDVEIRDFSYNNDEMCEIGKCTELAGFEMELAIYDITDNPIVKICSKCLSKIAIKAIKALR